MRQMTIRSGFSLLLSVLLCGAMAAACTTLGPDFHRPDAPLQDRWMEEHEPQVRSGPEPRLWWTVFGDPVLDHLVRLAYEQNIPLRVAGARIYQARARLGIAIGEQYPRYSRRSERPMRLSARLTSR